MNVSLYILGVHELSEKNMDFTFQLYFRHQWVDHRLSFSQAKYGGIGSVLISDPTILKNQIWQPDTFIPNAKSQSQNGFALIGRDANFLRVGSTGEVFTSKL